MSLKFLVLSLLLLPSLPCFAEIAKISDNQPLNEYLGMLIDMSDMESVQKVTLGNSKFLLVNSDLPTAKVVKDSTTGFNHFSALIGYNLSVDGVEESATRFLYFQCPISRHTYIDRSVPYYEIVDGKKTHIGSSIKLDTLKREYLAQGYYRFLSSTPDNNTAFGAAFPMSGKVSGRPEIDLMCDQIGLTYLKLVHSELNRDITLKNFGILE